MLETVIMNYYYRGTTQIDDMNRPLYSCTNIHASWITGLVPGDAYYYFRPPSKVHSAKHSIQQFHHLPLSVTS